MTNFSLLVILFLGVQSLTSEFLHRRKRDWIIASFIVDEGYKGPFPLLLGKVIVTQGNALNIFQIHGQGVDEEPLNVLEVDKDSGNIYMLGPVDRELYEVLKLTFVAYNKETHETEARLVIAIDILDTNDNPPEFEHQKYETSIEESTLQGSNLITVKATDRDSSEKNRKFDFNIDSVTPEPHDLEFFINKMPVSGIGTISFKGCLNYKKAEKYTLTVTARDHGKPEALSSSCTVIINIVAGNNHLPVFTKQTSVASVREGLENVLVSRLRVADEDTRGTRAWKAKYEIQGDKNHNWRITTDPETNDGLLFVEKQLDYEADPVRNITVTVENEIPYFTCKVKTRSTAGLWEIETIIPSSSKDATEEIQRPSRCQLTVYVEDVNEPPFFTPPDKEISVAEDVVVGQHLETFTARDPDITRVNKIRYVKGEDPADFVIVDPDTGKITTSNILDRESPFVKDGLYVVTIYAVENGEPPVTGTATLSIHISDRNDNAPSLAVSAVDMCQSDGTSLVNITVYDLDDDPNAGPFWFKLLGDVKDKWKVESVHGYSVSLVKESNVYSGHHELLLEVEDLQGKTAVHRLSVTVCDCLNVTLPNCSQLKATTSTIKGGALGIAFFCMILLAGMLLATFLVSCKRQKVAFPADNPEQHLMISNTEEPGTDCQVPFVLVNNNNNREQMPARSNILPVTMTSVITGSVTNSEAPLNKLNYEETSLGMTPSAMFMGQQWNMSQGVYAPNNMLRQQQRIFHNVDWLEQNQHIQESLLNSALKIMLTRLHAQDKELSDYEPVVFADEGESELSFELDSISIPELSIDPDLDSKFFTLASLCSPEITAHNAKTS